MQTVRQESGGNASEEAPAVPPARETVALDPEEVVAPAETAPAEPRVAACNPQEGRAGGEAPEPACVVHQHDPEFANATSEQDITTLPLPALRARERQAVIDALDALGAGGRALAHVRQFVADYPRDRRSNGYRMRVAQEDQAQAD